MGKNSQLDRELVQYKQNFYRIYNSKILPILTEFEGKRKKNLSLIIGIPLILTILVSVIYVYFFAPYADISFILFFLFLFYALVCIVGLLGGYFIISINSHFIKNLKVSCMPKIVAAFGNMKWYNQYRLISEKVLSTSQLFAKFNQRTSYDAFKGAYKGVDFEIEEVRLLDESGSGRDKTTIDVFRGVIIKVPVNKTVKGTTIVATKGDKNIRNRDASLGIALFCVFMQCLRFTTYETLNIVTIVVIAIIVIVFCYFGLYSKKSDIVLNEVKLEDTEFSKKYRVYSTDQVEGRYLVTPAFMERFKNLQTAFGAKNAKCSFCGNNLIFAISTNKNLFEIGNLFHNLKNPKQMTEFFNELSSILALIDYFKLDEKTGL